MQKMKPTIIFLLIFSLLAQSCTTYNPISREERASGDIGPDHHIRMTVSGTAVLEAEPYHYIKIKQPANLIIGAGIKKGRLGFDDGFHGVIPDSSIDSSVIDANKKLVCYCKDGSVITFKYEDYLRITPDQGTGFFCVGKMTYSISDSLYKGRIPQSAIGRIGYEKIEPIGTVSLVLGGAFVFLIVGLLVIHDSFALGGKE